MRKPKIRNHRSKITVQFPTHASTSEIGPVSLEGCSAPQFLRQIIDRCECWLAQAGELPDSTVLRMALEKIAADSTAGGAAGIAQAALSRVGGPPTSAPEPEPAVEPPFTQYPDELDGAGELMHRAIVRHTCTHGVMHTTRVQHGEEWLLTLAEEAARECPHCRLTKGGAA